MKILIASPYDWATPGGANVHIAGLARAMRARGHEVRIIAPSDSDAEPGVLTVGRTIGIPFNGSVARLTMGPRVAARVRIALRRAAPDILHVHEPFSPSVSLLALQAAKVPVVATFHAAIDSRLYRTAGRLMRRWWRKIDASIAVSPAAQASVESVFGPGPIIIPNGVELAPFAQLGAPDPAAKTVLYLGRLERRKGPHILVAAAPEILRSVPGSRIVLAGDGPLRRELEAAVPAEFADRVSFTGRFADVERADVLARATVVALPALGRESFGITLVEALAAARPVVASTIPGFAAVARDGLDALLVPAGDPAALARALVGVLRDPAQIERLSIAARARAAIFDWTEIAGRIEQVYREAVDLHRRGARSA
jgi:phosphatidylinositol alpha-mannosyltransferase